MTTATNHSELVGKIVDYKPDRVLRVRVLIREARDCYGRTDVYVTPIEGSGSRWVRLDSVEVGK